MQNPKGLLQEFYQKSHKRVPVYTQHKCKNGQFKSSVLCPDGTNFQSDKSFAKKVDADQYVAKIAYDSVYVVKEKKEVCFDDWEFFIDLENRPKAVDYLLSTFIVNATSPFIHVFVSKESPLSTQSFDDKYVVKHVINSDKRDGADVGMIIYLARRDTFQAFRKNAWIVTNDKFASTVTDLIPSLKHTTHIEQIEIV